MKQFIVVFLITCLNQFSYAQEDKMEGLFAFVYNSFSALPDSDHSISNATVEKVFHDLIEAKGVKSILPPKLVISNTESVAAWAQPGKQIIGIEKKALDICRSMGVDSLNAMAGLLAHELIHYYENHDWRNHFIHNYSELSTSAESDNGKQMEMEADDMGGLLAHMAGYNALDVMPTLLRKIYQDYKLDVHDNTSYPDLEQRVMMAEVCNNNLRNLIPIYELANYLMVINEIELAAEYLEYIVKKTGFVSREIQNNLGVLFAISAYRKRPDNKLEFIFPFQIDLETRLGTKGIDQQSFTDLVAKAIGYFEAAQSLDKGYEAAYINLACMYILTKDNFAAEYQLRKLTKEVDDIAADLDVLHGLMAAYDGEEEKATEFWKKAAAKKNKIAEINLRILQQQSRSEVFQNPSHTLSVDNIDLNKLYAMIAQDKITPAISIDINDNHSFYKVELETSDIYIHMDYEKDEQYCFFHIIDQPNNQLPLNIGESVDVLIDYYGEPDVIFSTYGGAIYNFKTLKMIAVIKDGKIFKWCIYKQSM